MGCAVGCAVGYTVGDTVGEALGCELGSLHQKGVGVGAIHHLVGDWVGTTLGAEVSLTVVGKKLGSALGCGTGLVVKPCWEALGVGATERRDAGLLVFSILVG